MESAPERPHRTSRPKGRSVTTEIRLASGVTMLQGRRGGLFPFVNSFRLDPPSGETCIIDPGFGHIDYLTGHANEFRHVLNSHYHPEHTSYNRMLGRPVRIHPLDAEAVRSVEEIRRRYGPLQGALLEEWRAWLVREADWAETPATEPLTQEFTDSLGFPGLKLIHAPGHTPGHVCYYFEREGLLLSFDIDLVPVGPWFGHAASDIDAWLATMETLISLAPRSVFSSHMPGDPPPGGVDALRKYLDVFHAREYAFVEFLREPRTEDEMVDTACRMYYRGAVPRPKPVWLYFARASVRHHLEHMRRTGRIAPCDAAGTAFRAV